ncbi:MAG: hypothetical protein ACKV22_40570 [Bryobacteraceae bacterium]
MEKRLLNLKASYAPDEQGVDVLWMMAWKHVESGGTQALIERPVVRHSPLES